MSDEKPLARDLEVLVEYTCTRKIIVTDRVKVFVPVSHIDNWELLEQDFLDLNPESHSENVLLDNETEPSWDGWIADDAAVRFRHEEPGNKEKD